MPDATVGRGRGGGLAVAPITTTNRWAACCRWSIDVAKAAFRTAELNGLELVRVAAVESVRSRWPVAPVRECRSPRPANRRHSTTDRDPAHEDLVVTRPVGHQPHPPRTFRRSETTVPEARSHAVLPSTCHRKNLPKPDASPRANIAACLAPDTIDRQPFVLEQTHRVNPNRPARND